MKKIGICGIYMIRSKIHPNKFYIGSSINIELRWSSHIERIKKKKYCCPLLGNYARKYGIENLEFSILEQFDYQGKDHLLSRERYYIELLNPTLNIDKEVKSGRHGVKNSEDANKNISASKTGVNHPNFGKHRPQDTRDKISEAHKDIPLSPEHCKALSDAKIGKPWSEKRRMAENKKQKENPSKYFIKMHTPKKPRSSWNKGIKMPKSTCEKMSIAKQGTVQAREVLDKRCASMILAWTRKFAEMGLQYMPDGVYYRKRKELIDAILKERQNESA